MVRFKLDQETKFKREALIHTQIDTAVSEKTDCESCFSSLLTASSCAYYYFIPVCSLVCKLEFLPPEVIAKIKFKKGI